MTNPDDDYDNPVGEVLDPEVARELASAHFTSSLAAILQDVGAKPCPRP